MGKVLLKLIEKLKEIFRGEVFFALFLLAGNFKSALSFLPGSIDLTIFFLGLSMVIAIKRLIKNPKILKCSIEAIYIFFLFIVVVLGSTFYSSSTIYSIEKSMRFLIITSWAYLGVFFLIKDRDSLKRFLNTMIFIGIIMSGIAIYQFVFIQKLSFSFTSVLGSNYLALGRTVGIGIIILFFYFVDEKKKLWNLLLILMIVQMTIALLISGGKMPLLSMGLVFSSYIFYLIISRTKDMNLKNGVKKLLLLMLLMIPLIIALANIGMFDVVIMRLTGLFRSLSSDTSTVGRITRYITALNMWGDKPILGKGVGSFPLFYSGTELRDYPHNIFLEILSELGILGFGVFTLLIVTSLYNGWRLFKLKFKGIDSLQMTLLLVFLYLFINANVSGSLNDNRLMFNFISLLYTSPYMERKVGGIDEDMHINNRTRTY